MGGGTGTQVTLWASSSSVTRRYGGPWPIWGLAAPMEAFNLPATYDKMENRRSVRRPQSGTW
ncbi:unnamed protein product [Staurois parvus]|uniref:Uncharacterized protein n=1 Tax=Staurois parvus TaxID=386267 RepID=A0ABN9BCW9_9NEOB|nr:unnamed protein product [Staurois parvus]